MWCRNFFLENFLSLSALGPEDRAVEQRKVRAVGALLKAQCLLLDFFVLDDCPIKKTPASIKGICRPLFEKTEIDRFAFVRAFFKEGSRFVLTTETEKQGCLVPVNLQTGTLAPPMTAMKGERYQLWRYGPKAKGEKEKTRGSMLGGYYGITVIEARPHYDDYFYFGTACDKDYMHSFYLNHLDLLELFILYFKDKAKAAIHLSSQASNRLKLSRPLALEETVYAHYVRLALQNKQDFLKFIKPKRALFGAYKDVLTGRELDIVACMLLGLSAGEMAEKLYLSPRTVENHISRVYSKLGCHRKSELIEKCLTLRLNYLVALQC